MRGDAGMSHVTSGKAVKPTDRRLNSFIRVTPNMACATKISKKRKAIVVNYLNGPLIFYLSTTELFSVFKCPKNFRKISQFWLCFTSLVSPTLIGGPILIPSRLGHL